MLILTTTFVFTPSQKSEVPETEVALALAKSNTARIDFNLILVS